MKLGIKLSILALLFPVFVFASIVHTVKKGESLAIIAKKYGVTLKELIKLNKLKKPYIIKPGQKLKIPVKTAKKSDKSRSSSCVIVHKVKPGESLIIIAKKYHVWVKDIKRLNNLKSNVIRAGQTLCIKKGAIKNSKSKNDIVKIEKKIVTKIIYHRVKSGENLSLIAQKYGTSVSKIIKLNKLKKPYIIKPGQKLKIPKKIVKIRKITKQDQLKSVQKSMPFGFIWPVENGKVIATFINSSTLRHLGIDIKTNCNMPVKAVEAGKVIYAGNSIKAYGNLVIIKHRHRYNTVYGHLGKIAVKDGQYVKKGETIGYTGKLNNSEDCGVYFEIRKNAVPIDPLVLLPKNKEVKN